MQMKYGNFVKKFWNVTQKMKINLQVACRLM